MNLPTFVITAILFGIVTYLAITYTILYFFQKKAEERAIEREQTLIKELAKHLDRKGEEEKNE